MRFLLTIPILLFPLFSVAQTNTEQAPAGIEWLSWEEAVLRNDTSSAKKKIFIDIYTDWCGWCKKMDNTTFADPAVVKSMSDGYFAVKLDAEMAETVSYNGHDFVNPNPGAKRSVHQLAGSLLDGQMSYPSYVMLDENMTRVSVFKGYQQVPDMFSILTFFGRNHYLNHNKFMYGQWEQQLKVRQQQLLEERQQAAQPVPGAAANGPAKSE